MFKNIVFVRVGGQMMRSFCLLKRVLSIEICVQCKNVGKFHSLVKFGFVKQLIFTAAILKHCCEMSCKQESKSWFPSIITFIAVQSMKWGNKPIIKRSNSRFMLAIHNFQ